MCTFGKTKKPEQVVRAFYEFNIDYRTLVSLSGMQVGTLHGQFIMTANVLETGLSPQSLLQTAV